MAKYFIYSSSAVTFDESKYTPIDAVHEQKPINPYDETKLIGKRLLRDYEKVYGIKDASLRYFNAAGVDSDVETWESNNQEHYLLTLIFQTALEK